MGELDTNFKDAENHGVLRCNCFQFLICFHFLLQEKILEIEYTKAVAPRKEEEPSLHDDWVSAVDGSNPR